MLMNLQTKIEQNLQLNIQLDEIKDAYKCLEEGLGKDDKERRNKMNNLERTLEQVYSQYQSSVNEKSLLKVDLQVAERKVEKFTQRHSELQKKYEKMRAKNESLEKILIQVKKEIQTSKMSDQNANPTGVRQSTGFGMRGGGAATKATPRPTEQQM